MPTVQPPRAAPLPGRRRLLVGVLLGLLLGAGACLLGRTHTGQRLELALLDLRTQAFAGRTPPAPDLLLMQVEDADIESVQRDLGHLWPWPLEVNAALARTLAEAGARGLMVDVYHLDRGAGPDDLAGPAAATREALAEVEEQAAMAEDYGAALQQLGAVALAFELAEVGSYGVPARVQAARERLAVPGLVAPPGAPRLPEANFPVRRVTQGARALGFANAFPDADGVVRRATPLARLGEATVLSLPLAMAFALGEGSVRDGRPVVRGRALATDAHGALLLDFRAPADRAYARLSPTTVLRWSTQRDAAGGLPPEAAATVKGKVVVYGVNAAGLADTVATPLARAQDGPEVQATILDNLLHGGSRLPAPGPVQVLFTLLVAVLVGLGAMGPRGRLLPPLLALGTLGLACALAVGAFASGIALDLFAPLAAGTGTWLAATGLRLLTEGRYNRWLEGAFSRYLAPSVIEALKQDPGLLELGGRTREVSVLFSDVAGFTTHSEHLTPAQLSRLLNEYLSAHCEAVFREEGVVDKFIGDAVMAFWGDPVDQPDHAVRACRTALAVQASLPALEPTWRALGLPGFVVRIGINSGPATLGNMGSRQRFDYTALGDTVNLASRLEGANKAFGTLILLGDAARRRAGEAILAKPLARLAVVGKHEAVPVHELVALAATATEAQRAHVAAFTRAGDALRADDLPAARTALDEALRHLPGDAACAWLRGVLEALEQGRLARPWDGTVTLGSK